MNDQKLNVKKNPIKLDISIVFSKPIQISPPSTPEEIYTIKSKSSRSTLNNKNTNVQSRSNNSQSILQLKNNFYLPYFPKSTSPKKLKGQQLSPLILNRNTQVSIDSPISLRQKNRRATNLCSKVLQKYKNKYCI